MEGDKGTTGEAVPAPEDPVEDPVAKKDSSPEVQLDANAGEGL